MNLRLSPKLGIVALLALVLALGVAACGGSSSSSSSSEPSSSEEEQSGGEEAAETGSEPEAAAGGEAETTSAGGTPSWCGEKEITLALADGFGDNNWRKITRAEAEAEANECPSF